MVLSEYDEALGGNVMNRATLAAFVKLRILAAVSESPAISSDEVFDLAVILIIPDGPPGEQRAHRMMKIIAPHGVQLVAAAGARPDQTRIVGSALGDQIDAALQLRGERFYFGAQLGEKRLR